MKVNWHTVWGWAFILLGVASFWAGLVMFLLDATDGRGFFVWSLMIPGFCTGMVWAMVKADS